MLFDPLTQVNVNFQFLVIFFYYKLPVVSDEKSTNVSYLFFMLSLLENPGHSNGVGGSSGLLILCKR